MSLLSPKSPTFKWSALELTRRTFLKFINKLSTGKYKINMEATDMFLMVEAREKEREGPSSTGEEALYPMNINLLITVIY
jgi:hypothetical protein